MLWYNGRKGNVEQIGLATHPGRELWPQPDPTATSRPSVLEADTFRPYVEEFNRHDEELYVQHIDNAAAWEFLPAVGWAGKYNTISCPAAIAAGCSGRSTTATAWRCRSAAAVILT